MHIQHKRRCVHHLPCYKEKFGSAQLERTCSAPDELSGRIESLCGEVRVTRLHILRNVVAGNRRPIASRVSGALPRRHHLSNRFGRRLRGRLTGYFVSPPPTSGLSFCETAAPSGSHAELAARFAGYVTLLTPAPPGGCQIDREIFLKGRRDLNIS